MRRVWIAAAAVFAAAAILALVSLPPKSFALAPASDRSLAGIIHVHSNRSDGRSSPDEIAAAAAKAGLAFVVFTDHGNGMGIEAPIYPAVLCISGVEISTTGGHYIALDMPPSPYPLGGEPRDVVEDVRRLGGFGYAAHPDSPRAELRWTDWALPMDGMEILNPDTSWRARVLEPGVRSKMRLFEGLLTYPFRPEETIAHLLTNSSENITRWETIAEQRPFVGLAGADAHDKLALWNVDPGDNRYSLPFPGYGVSFRTQSVHLDLASPLTGNAVADAELAMSAIRRGHLYLAIDAFATPPSLEFSAVSASRTAHEGDELAAGAPVTLRVRTNAPPAFSTNVWRNQSILASSQKTEIALDVTGDPAIYRVDVRPPGPSSQPAWLLSNPIYVRSAGREQVQETQAAPAADSAVLFGGRDAMGWRPEHGPADSAQMDVTASPSGQSALRLRYVLSNEASATAALLAETAEPIAGSDRLTFRASADRPMRVSVQLRTFGQESAPEERWHRSIYLDRSAREVVVPFGEMTPLGPARTARPALSEIRHVLFVVDTTNTKPGSSGQIWIERVALQRP